MISDNEDDAYEIEWLTAEVIQLKERIALISPLHEEAQREFKNVKKELAEAHQVLAQLHPRVHPSTDVDTMFKDTIGVYECPRCGAVLEAVANLDRIRFFIVNDFSEWWNRSKYREVDKGFITLNVTTDYLKSREGK